MTVSFPYTIGWRAFALLAQNQMEEIEWNSFYAIITLWIFRISAFQQPNATMLRLTKENTVTVKSAHFADYCMDSLYILWKFCRTFYKDSLFVWIMQVFCKIPVIFCRNLFCIYHSTWFKKSSVFTLFVLKFCVTPKLYCTDSEIAVWILIINKSFISSQLVAPF